MERILVALNDQKKILGLAVSGSVVEWDHDLGHKESGSSWDEVLSDRNRPEKPGIYIWEGNPIFGDEGPEYPLGNYRELTTDDWSHVRQGIVQLWPRGPISEEYDGPDNS